MPYFRHGVSGRRQCVNSCQGTSDLQQFALCTEGCKRLWLTGRRKAAEGLAVDMIQRLRGHAIAIETLREFFGGTLCDLVGATGHAVHHQFVGRRIIRKTWPCPYQATFERTTTIEPRATAAVRAA